MEVVTGDRYLESLVKFVEKNAGQLIEGSMVLKVNPVGLHYVHSRFEALGELESLISGAPVDYLRAYISDLGDHRAIEQLRRIFCRLTSLKVVSVLPPPARDPTPLSLLPFGRLKVLELRGCDLSTSAARGLIELRHTLEKLICHNSTDALRHVFASRISEIKDSPQWNRLSFVSCATNRLVLMDESLQLLPAVEILDLSRNKFAKVDNLRMCTKLRHLDLGFNRLRSVAPFREITCRILKLVLRNNSLTTLRGIDSLESLEELDLSCNIISNLSELEILSALPSLRNLWLEGNPLCCAGWYRPQVFSLFPYPDKLKLDDREISAREFWKRQIVIARRQTRPASYGFYSPAKEDTEEQGELGRKTRKSSRLACIENEDLKSYSDQDSVLSDNEIQSEDEKAPSVVESEVAGLNKRMEAKKKEHSVRQLRDFDNLVDGPSESNVNGSKYGSQMPISHVENYLKTRPGSNLLGESFKYESDSIYSSDYSISNVLESESSFSGLAAHNHDYQFLSPEDETVSKVNHDQPLQKLNAHLNQDFPHLHMKKYQPLVEFNSHTGSGATRGGNNLNVNVRTARFPTGLSETQASYGHPRSPPHFQADIFQRLHDWEEEHLQLSAETFSIASSDSDTSSDEDETFGHATQCHDGGKLHQLLQGEDADAQRTNQYQSAEVSEAVKTGRSSLDPRYEQSCDDVLGPECSAEVHRACHMNEELSYPKQEAENSKEIKYRRRAKKRDVPLLGEDDSYKNGVSCEAQHSDKDNSNARLFSEGFGDQTEDLTVYTSEMVNNEHAETIRTNISLDKRAGVVPALGKQPVFQTENLVEHYFNSVVANSRAHETCREFIFCGCIVEQETRREEREVIVVLSSEGKLYSILANAVYHGSGHDGGLITSYKVNDVSGILVGLGLQVVRVYVAEYAAFIYVMKSAEKSRQFLHMLETSNSDEASHFSCLRSLECVQIDLFDKKICGHSKFGIYQYSMVLFTREEDEDVQWISRSLFVSDQQLFVCIEDVKQFGSLSADSAFSDYFLLESVCCIADVSELVELQKVDVSRGLSLASLEPGVSSAQPLCLRAGVVERKGSHCVTLRFKSSQSESCLSGLTNLLRFSMSFKRGKGSSQSQTWRLKWSSEATLLNFVTLLKAIHAGLTMSTLSITFVS